MKNQKLNKETGELTVARPYIRKPYERVRTTTPVIGESMTHQSHAETCDINNIIRKFDNTGTLPPARYEPQYADVTGLQTDLTEAYNQAKEKISLAKSFAKEREEKRKQSLSKKQLDLEQEIEQLKKQANDKPKLSPEPPDGSSPSPSPSPTSK